MAVGGIGGLFGQLLNPNLDRSLAAGITPDPRPLAQMPAGGQGAPGQGGGSPPSQAPSMAPAAVTQPDPITAQYNSALTANADRLRAARMDAYGADLNRNIEGIAAGFGTEQQQASKQAALRGGGGVGSSLADLAASQAIGDRNVTDSEHARFMANASVFGQILRGQGINVTDAQATEIMNNPNLLSQIGGAAAQNAETTGTAKDADAATRAWAKANPKATPQEIEAYRSNLIAGGMGGSDLDQREYLAAKAADPTIGTFADWKARHAAEATTLVTQAKDKTEAKDQAVLDYPNIDANLSRSEEIIKKLLANKKATIDAINTMPSRKTGWWAANTPWGASEEVRTAAADLQTLMSTLAGEGLKNVKNVRNVREFNALADSLSAGLKAGNTDAGIESTLTSLLNRFGTTREIAREQAGLPKEEKPQEDSGGPAPVKRRHYNEKGELVD